jgi:hypothetical protein
MTESGALCTRAQFDAAVLKIDGSSLQAAPLISRMALAMPLLRGISLRLVASQGGGRTRNAGASKNHKN